MLVKLIVIFVFVLLVGCAETINSEEAEKTDCQGDDCNTEDELVMTDQQCESSNDCNEITCSEENCPGCAWQRLCNPQKSICECIPVIS